MKQQKEYALRMTPATYYVWIGGSCDYGHEQRCSGGAYIIQKDDEIIETYVISDDYTTEFRMILSVMIHAMEVIPEGSDIIFLTNVSYILQNWDKEPTEKSANRRTKQEQSEACFDSALQEGGRPKANADLIRECISNKGRHHSANVKLIPFHKYHTLPETHELAHEAMMNLRQGMV